MQSKRLFSVVFLAGLSVAYGCHTIAGVHTDAILENENASSSSSSSSGSAGAGGMAGAGGAGGAAGMGGSGGGNCIPTDCASGMCNQGACVPVNGICTESGTPFYVFVPTDFVKADSKMLVGYNSKAAYVVVSDEPGPNKFRVRSIDSTGKLANIVDCDVATNSTNMVSVWTTETQLVLQGHLGGANARMAELAFPTDDPEGKITGPCVEMAMPSWPQCVNRIESEVFTRVGGVTKYATTCTDSMDSTMWHLVTGGQDEPSYTDITSGPNTDLSLRAVTMGYINNDRVIFAGPDLVGDFFFRRESMGYAPQQIDFSGDAARQESVFALIPEVEGQSAYLIGASSLLPPKLDASLLGGLLSDMNQFATVPTAGMKEFVHLSGAEVAKIGTYGQVAKDDISYYAAIIPIAKKSVDVYWFTKKGEALISGQTVYQVPAGDPTAITRVAFVPLGFQRLVLWREENAGAVTVRGQRFVCSY